jgi:hypothetical protein
MGAAAVALIIAVAFGLGRKPGEMRDFEVYWTAAGRAAAAKPLYRTDDGHYQFKYLPAFAVVAAPIAALPLETAKRAWFAVSLALVYGLLSFSLSILPERRRIAALIVAATVVVMGKFYGHELVLGQVNLLFAVLATAGIYLLVTGEIMAATLLFVGAVVIKPYAALFLPWLIVLKGRLALATVCAGGLVILAAPLPLYGYDQTIALHRQWWATVTDSTAPNLTNADNVSLAGFFAKWMGQGAAAGAAAAIAGVAGLVVAAIAILSGRGIRRREALEGCLLLVLIPLLSPQGWDYVFLIATPAIALLVNYTPALPAPMRILTYAAMVTIGLSVFDLMGRERYATFMAWSVITVCFVVLFAALVALRQRRIA